MSILPKKIENEFQEYHMELTWQELKTRFGFDVRGWKKQFREAFSKQPRNVTEVEFFLIFGNRNINFLLNQILCRNNQHPTFNKLIDYILDKEGYESNKANSGYSKRW